LYLNLESPLRQLCEGRVYKRTERGDTNDKDRSFII
jgi:hypothetical protein